MMYSHSRLVDTDYGPELECTVFSTDRGVLWCSQEAMSWDGQLKEFREFYSWHGEIIKLKYVGEILDPTELCSECGEPLVAIKKGN